MTRDANLALVEAREAIGHQRFDEAERSARLALAQLPGHAEAAGLLGEALLGQGRVDDAALAFRDAVMRDPALPWAWSGLAAASFDQLRWAEAARAANRALREDHAEARALLVRAGLRERRGDLDGAWRDQVRAWRIDPEVYPLPQRLDDEAIEAAVREVTGRLHPTLREVLATVPIVVEDVPSEEVLRSWDPPASPFGLVGFFSGTSLRDRSLESPWSALPGVILLFRCNLQRMARSPEELHEELRVTLAHEIGHLLGLDEDDLARRGLD